MRRRLLLSSLVLALFAAFVAIATLTPGVTSALWFVSREGRWVLPLVTVAAVLDSVNPCAFSALLITIATLVAFGRRRNQILRMGGAYVLGVFGGYLLIGLGLLGTFHLFAVPHLIGKLGAAALILLGTLTLLGVAFPRFPLRPKIPDAAHHTMAVLMDRASLPAALGLGVLVALCEMPCTGGPYLMVLGLLRDAGTYATGLGYLLWYNALFILPLVLIVLIASDAQALVRVQRWYVRSRRTMRLLGGAAAILLGLLTLSL